ncbi:MAG TPA: GNAT family N-acetyltransferase [Pyrinomonadaceae bacterium]
MSYQIANRHSARSLPAGRNSLALAPDMAQVGELRDEHTAEVLAFLTIRPVHTIVMTSFINDNGLVSSLNRGKFYGFRDSAGKLEGVALIGHTTLVEARTEESLKAFAFVARESETPIHLIMSDGSNAESFWQYYSGGARQPRLVCTELLFEVTFPVMVRETSENLRLAAEGELTEAAEAHAEVALLESGVNPLEKDREGFLQRTLRRIRQERTFVVFEDGKLLFKADIVAETADVVYLEGIYVAPDQRGMGTGSKYLSQLSRMLLNRVKHVCLLSNVDFKEAHSAYVKAGFKSKDSCTTIFV